MQKNTTMTTKFADRDSAPRMQSPPRRLPIGAEYGAGTGVRFRVWAPRRRQVEVIFEDQDLAAVRLEREANGYFSGTSADARPGALYRFRLDGESQLYPDPASRFQPHGPHGPSQVVDPHLFQWSDEGWKGVSAHGQVLYEMHVGTFTSEGTWAAATAQLDSLKDLGVTCLEVMPIAEFPGDYGWGYDGVALFAPYHNYGSPDEFRAFVDRAHALGIGVILDVVYNHLGPDGNYLTQYSDTYFDPEHCNDWGEAINFGSRGSEGAREYYLANALYWIDEFHLDGYRYDATQAIVDNSKKHILAEIADAVRAAAKGKSVYLINENEPQDTRLVRPAKDGGYGMDALWNDDFHHSAMAAITGHNEAYYTDNLGTPQEFISTAKWGYLYQGQRYTWQAKRRGTPALDLPPTAFVNFIQNHDQIANSARGLRAHLLSSPGEYKAMTALMLLMPQTPMLFQGQEYAETNPFFYFADHNAELGKLIRAGRAREISQFASAATPEMQRELVNPCARETFLRSKLNHAIRREPWHQQIFQLHKALLKLRREDPVFNRVQRRGDLDGAVLGPGAFILRYFGEGNDDRLIVVNFLRDLAAIPAPEPLLAPPLGKRWSLLLSTDEPRFGGGGAAAPDTEDEGWYLPGRCAVVLRPAPIEEATVQTRIVRRGSDQSARRKPLSPADNGQEQNGERR